jgi:predicted DsbA family dithiol-disulfide isomerase
VESGVPESKPELKVTVFSDYICPFCYVGDARLKRLREAYDLRVNWCFLEIHPETSPAGEPVAALDYSADRWRRMMAALHRLAREEGLALREHDFTTSSHSALQLAEAAKFIDPELFYRLHASLFEAFFLRGENIGDRVLLRRLGQEAGMSEQEIERAWVDQAARARLKGYRLAAAELEVRATPTFFIGERRLDGVVPVEQMFAAARAAT